MPGASPGMGQGRCGCGPTPLGWGNTSRTLGLGSRAQGCCRRDKPKQLPPSSRSPHQPQEEPLLRQAAHCPSHHFVNEHKPEPFPGEIWPFLLPNTFFICLQIDFYPTQTLPQGPGPPWHVGTGRAPRHAASPHVTLASCRRFARLKQVTA